MEEKTTILYFYDALCGLCYGFSPVIQKIYQENQEQFDFHIISGGLKLGEAVGPIGVVAPYIKAGAYKTVEEKCGVKFGEAFVNGPMEKGDMIFNSEPPAIALAIVKEKMPEQAFAFGSILHQAIYVDGMHPEDLPAYVPYAAKIGLDGEAFIAEMAQPHYLEAAKKDFAMARHFGINGFPAMVGIKGDSAFLISHGYMAYEALTARLNTL
ncbi:MAG: DsbA family protein [Bacteroidota bacterium]